MKRFISLLILLSVMAMLSACSSKTSLELIDKEVKIYRDKERTGSMILKTGEEAGQEVIPATLSYSFSIKNVGSKKVGEANEDEDLMVRIEPNEKLLTVSKEVMGFNIFSPEEYSIERAGLRYEHSFRSVLEPNSVGQYFFKYTLGYVEETEEVFAPSKEQLGKLKENAFEATLVVLVGNEEIARFHLSKKE
ncbi:hypothetical protein AB1K89_06870 [Sporosarcina sp. 179-K 8C2 HS]|uniref:LptM family lipoprotein n=1 Tax=Sporosarcina sp. 179-K 8C2 HS TaxID=3142387 RepID=UPI00399F262F